MNATTHCEWAYARVGQLVRLLILRASLWPRRGPRCFFATAQRTMKSNLHGFCKCVIAFALIAGQTAYPAESPSMPEPPQPSEAMPGSDSQASYIIGPGDVLQVFVWRNPELTAVVPVRPDGKISTPLVEDMVAIGKTPSQLARDIEGVLATYVRSPQVNVIVTTPVSTFSQVRVIGQVDKPQAIPYWEGMTVLDAV